MEMVYLRSVDGIGLQVALRQVRNLIDSGETTILITSNGSSLPSLEGPGSARTTDPETSKAAAAKNKPLSKRRRQVLAWLVVNGPGCTDDIADGLGIDGDWVSPRLNDLAVRYDPPLAYKTGRTFISPKSNRANEEWDATEIGRKWIESKDG